MGVDAQGFPGLLRLDPVCRASFLMTFAMGGVPHSGPQHLPLFYLLKQPDAAQLRASECSAEES